MIWTVRQYGLPFLLALALHAALGVWLKGVWQPDRSDPLDAFKPKMVHSTLLVLEPKAQPKPKPAPPKAQPAPQPAPAKVEPPKPAPAKPDPAVEAARRQAEQQEVARLNAAREKARAEEAARQQRLQALAEAAFLNSLEDESADLAQEATDDAEAVAQSYQYGIYQRVVANWSRPPSARNGMQARLQVELVPTGDVVAVMLLESSGNAAFDQSAEAAVKKAGRFEVPKENAIFERYFRRFTLLFKPEDLLR
ncbi:MAG TPA: cell envelope integrity protein TolA [Pseudomonadales bacterium]